MIAAVDIGNTRTKLALFHPDGRTAAEEAWSSDDPELPARAARALPSSLDRSVIGSVVPRLTPLWSDLLVARSGLLHVAGHDSPWGFRVETESPESVGVDRLAGLEGALVFPGSLIVVDAGTATKFDLLEGVGRRSFPGGAIAPGLELSYRALLERAAQLRPVELDRHSPVVGYNTETAIRSGVLHGFASLVDGMVARIFEERRLPQPVTVIATGGNAAFLRARARLITHYRPQLTLEGLHALVRKI